MTDLIIITLEIVTGLLSAYLIYYAQQKGKNQADKEDLKKITQIVEDVKKKNNEDIELLKANLSFLTEKEKQVYSEGKEAIVVFFSQLNTWIWTGLNIYIHEYNHINYQEISQRLITMRDAYNTTNVSYSKVKLIIEDENLVELGREAISATLKFHLFLEALLKRLSMTLNMEKSLWDQILKENDLGNLSPEIQKFYTEQGEKRDKKKREIIDEYFEKQTEMFKTSMISINAFKDAAKKYIRE